MTGQAVAVAKTGLRWTTMALLSVVVAAGCSTAGQDGATGRTATATETDAPAAVATSPTAATTATAAATADDQPRYGGTLVLAGSDPGPLNPAITSAGTTHPVTGQIFNGLVRLDRDYEPQPDLAESWDVSDDGLTYTFDLAQGVQWHDGMPFTSADVKFTFEEVLLQEHPRTAVTLGPVLEGIDTPDDTTVVFRLRQPYPPLLKLVDEDNAGILPQHLFEGTDPRSNPANGDPVGTGPFMFDSAVQGDRITLVRNPNYFKDGLPYLDSIVFRIIPDPQALQAFQAGDVDVFSPTPQDLQRLEGTQGVRIGEDENAYFATVIRLIPNLERPPFDDPRVRYAMAYAIDREFIADAVYPGVRIPATGPITHQLTPFYTDDVMAFPHDPEQAAGLLDEAGLAPGPDGVRFRVSFIFDPGFARTADLLKEQLGEVGIALDLQQMEFQSWVQQLYIQKDFDLGYSQLTDAPHPDIGTKRAWTCDNIRPVPFSNGQQYCNPDVDALFAQAASEADTDRQVQLYQEIQQLIVEDMPAIFVADGAGPSVYRDEFRGFEDAAPKARYYFGETVWWTEGTEEPES